METLTFLLTTSFYPPNHIGGDAVHVAYLAEELAKRGHIVHVLYSLDAYTVKKGAPRTVEQSSGITFHQIKSPLSLSAYAAYTLGSSHTVMRKFQEIVKSIEPDILHHHNISLLGYSLLKKCDNYLNLYTAHDYWLICQQNNLLLHNGQVCSTGRCRFCGLRSKRLPQFWRYRNDFKKAVNQVDQLIAPSNYLKERINNIFNIKSVTIPNFAPEPQPKPVTPNKSDFILYAGVLEKHKGVHRLVEEYENAENLPKLMIVGQGSLQSKIDDSVKKFHLSEKVDRLGWVDRERLLKLLATATALVVPSIWPENSPLIALEALSLGTPIVCSNRGGLPEITSSLDKELSFSWEIKDDLKRALHYSTINNKELREKASRAYLASYSPSSFINSYMQLIGQSDRTMPKMS